MTTWTKIANLKAPKPRTQPAIQRRVDRAELLLPKTMVAATRADVYRSEDGRVAVHFCTTGGYAVQRMGDRDRATGRITVPADAFQHLPYGTTDISIAREGDLLVIAA